MKRATKAMIPVSLAAGCIIGLSFKLAVLDKMLSDAPPTVEGVQVRKFTDYDRITAGVVGAFCSDPSAEMFTLISASGRIYGSAVIMCRSSDGRLEVVRD